MRVWVLQTGEYLPYIHTQHRPMRAANICRSLVDAGHEVVLWSSTFVHNDHSHISDRDTVLRPSPQMEIRLVHSMGYRRHVGFRRLADHSHFAAKLSKQMKRAPLPDVAVVGFPPIESASAATRLLTNESVPVILDVKDQWPEVWSRALPGPTHFSTAALCPYRLRRDLVFKRADGIMSITPEFQQWALAVADRPKRLSDLVLPLTLDPEGCNPAELATAREFWEAEGLGAKRNVISYVGTISGGLDIKSISSAARTLPECNFVICGDGSERSALTERTRDLSNVTMPGWVTSAQAAILLGRSTATLVPYIDEPAFNLSVPNKAYDAMSRGVPIVTTLGGALGNLVEGRRIGKSTKALGGDLAATIRSLVADQVLAAELGRNGRELFQTEFSFAATYGQFPGFLEEVAARNQRGRCRTP